MFLFIYDNDNVQNVFKGPPFVPNELNPIQVKTLKPGDTWWIQNSDDSNATVKKVLNESSFARQKKNVFSAQQGGASELRWSL